MTDWARNAEFYQIYPLGFCGAPQRNDFTSSAVPRLEKISEWLDHIQELGINALYLGPVFESSAHGYDTSDYFNVDRRLGTNETLSSLSAELHQRGIRLVLDGVFNHVGRDFWAFKDVRQKGQASPFCGWFKNLKFGQTSTYGDPFTYEGWNEHMNLVKLDLGNFEVRNHLFEAVRSWVANFNIDGIRLDAADCLDFAFLAELSRFCKSLKPDFWLMGEVIHGDYTRWAGAGMLDSVTNYEAHKGLWSSLNDANYFEIAYALKRQSGQSGVYKHLSLYNFVDNHDVNRVASTLNNSAHLFPLHIMLYTMPGVPSIYYGSEFGVKGIKIGGDDAPLRPHLPLQGLQDNPPAPDLMKTIQRLSAIRKEQEALRRGDYRELFVSHKQMAFERQSGSQTVIVAVNAEDQEAWIDIPISGTFADHLNPEAHFAAQDGHLKLPLNANWGRILVAR